MATEPTGVMPMPGSRGPAEAIRSALGREFEEIARSVGAMVRSVDRSRGREWLRQRTEEVLAEAVCRALERPESYDPGRPAKFWIVGIAWNVMRGEARVESGRPRRAVLDEAAWESAIGVIDLGGRKAADHFDVERMLSRISPQHRKLIELRYLRGLSDDEIVAETGAPSAGAARVRVCRALQALCDICERDGLGVDR